MLDNKKRNKDKDQVENNKESKLLKDAIKEVFEHALLEKNISEDRFKEVIDNKNLFLEIFNPWHKEDEDGGLIKNFVDQINKQDFAKDFSWLDILDTDKRWEQFLEKNPEWNKLEDKNKNLNMRYQIPTHFHGDINEAIIFHCMENPRGYLGGYGDNQIDSGFGKTNLKGYYGKSYKLLNEDKSKRKTIEKIKNILKTYPENKDIKEIIYERYQLKEDVKQDSLSEHIKNIIYSDTESALGREIEHIYKQDEDNKYYNFDFENEKEKNKVLLKDYYYLKEYYSQLIQTNQKLDFKKLKNEKEAVKEIADKICNVEIYPFSCAQPNLGEKGIGKTILLNSDLSRLGAYIVLRRIYRYLNDKREKPVIVFRKYDRAWEDLFKEIFEKSKISKYENVLKLLEKTFFYCQLAQQGGGITNGNVISVPNYKTLLSMKKDAFEKISDLLPRIDIDKISEKESGNE